MKNIPDEYIEYGYYSLSNGEKVDIAKRRLTKHIHRSRGLSDGLASVGSLTSYHDLISDIDEDVSALKSSKTEEIRKFRKEHSVDDKGLIILYLLDAHVDVSIQEDGESTRASMNALKPVPALTILFPSGSDVMETVSIRGV